MSKGAQQVYSIELGEYVFIRDRWDNVADFTWWSDSILILAKLTGVVTMLDILSGAKLIDSDPIFSMPVLERVRQCQGCVFVLENLSCKERYSHASHVERETLEIEDKRKGKGTQYRFSQLDIDTGIHVGGLEKRVQAAEGHVDAGRLLAYYQVPKPIKFLLESQSDEKGVKQILRLILSKFGRRQPGRSDNDWANIWRDMQCFQGKAFPFLDLEYMLMEFCRGLLKAGKFSLARNYLKGTSTVCLTTEKAENLVIQAAREYFFSASSLSCSEVLVGFWSITQTDLKDGLEVVLHKTFVQCGYLVGL